MRYNSVNEPSLPVRPQHLPETRLEREGGVQAVRAGSFHFAGIFFERYGVHSFLCHSRSKPELGYILDLAENACTCWPSTRYPDKPCIHKRAIKAYMTEQATEFSDEAASQPRPLRVETPQESSCEPPRVETADPCGPEVPW